MINEKSEFEKFFNPKSIAIVGVPRGKASLGGLSYLSRFKDSGFSGKLFPINPKATEILDLPAYPNLSTLPEVPELCIVSVSAGRVLPVLEECASIGLKHIHILTAGFKEIGTEEGKRLEAEIASFSKENSLLVIGPNCMGPYCPSSGLTAWGAIPGIQGPVGILSQSGGIAQRLTEYICSMGLGVNKAVSFGNAAVLDCCDYLEYMADEEEIKAIAMYLESVSNSRKFLKLAREVGRKKPILLWKGGESEAGARIAASHTGAIASDQRLWDTFFKQTGVIRVRSMSEWVDAMMALCLLPAPPGKGVFLMGGGGGNGVANGDICVREGLEVPPLSQVTMKKLRESVPMAGSIAGNPLDSWRVFTDADYVGELLGLANEDPAIGMIVVDRLIGRKAFHMPELDDPTPATIENIIKYRNKKPVVITLDSDGGDKDLAATGAKLRADFCTAGIPSYPTLKRAARALVHLYNYHDFFKKE